jgi:hypothetical protein
MADAAQGGDVKVREHPVNGPYIEGLTKSGVRPGGGGGARTD